MLIKNGQKVNRIQALGRDGQLTDTVINLDWINAKLQYSWAEGPVPVTATGGEKNWKAFTKSVKNISGRHDLILKFSPGTSRDLFVKTIRFLPSRRD